MDDLALLFGRPRRAQDAEDRFELEALAAEELGIESFAIPLDLVSLGDPERALARLPRPRGRRWLYRGWMLDEDEYTALYDAMSERDETLVVDPASFAEATYAPSYLPLLGARTAPARWTEGESLREAWEVGQELGPPPWVLKDHVKSAKEEWHRACFVPAGATFDDFAAIGERLLELRGDRFARGFVIKRYLELATLAGWAPERRRVTDEHRLVFWDGALVAHAPYYDVDAALDQPGQFAWLGETIGSPFFTADVARLASGGYTVLELNDGGCSTLPERMDPRDLYRRLLTSEDSPEV
jgi:ATP-grasp domain, R2K clade family 3